MRVRRLINPRGVLVFFFLFLLPLLGRSLSGYVEEDEDDCEEAHDVEYELEQGVCGVGREGVRWVVRHGSSTISERDLRETAKKTFSYGEKMHAHSTWPQSQRTENPTTQTR
jgi:hypothetical protein